MILRLHRILNLTGIVIMGALLFACSEPDKNQEAANTSGNQATNAAPQIQEAQEFPSGGKVVKAMHASGYTYMQVENRGKLFWVAAKMLNVRRNDYVSWTQPSLQKNFNSPTLRRTFDEILFVASATVDK